MENQLQRTPPEAQGIASASILGFIEAADAQIDELHSFMLVRHGSVVAEGWWSPYAAERPHMLFSLSKSFTSSAIGLAVTEGRLSIDDFVTSFFPDDLPEPVSENLAAMRVRHLLSMNTGHAEDTTMFLRQREDGNWIKAFLAQPVVHAPGTYFLYNSGATYMLSAIIQKLTGMTLLAYLQPRLLEPLGIEGATWESSPQGINTGGWGMNIKTEDIARFGQLYLQKGVWQGKRILPEDWIALATREHSDNRKETPESDWEQGYGFQFWLCRHNAYRGDGAFGQYCVVMPEQDAVIAITSSVKDMQAVLNLIWDRLLPAMSAAPLPADAAAQEKLTRKLSSLALNPPQGKRSSPVAARISGRAYKVDTNAGGVETISLDFADDCCVITTKTASGEHRAACGYGAWQEGRGTLLDDDTRVVASGVWTAEDTFTMTMRLYETPFYYTVVFKFTDGQVAINGDANATLFEELSFAFTGRLV